MKYEVNSFFAFYSIEVREMNGGNINKYETLFINLGYCFG